MIVIHVSVTAQDDVIVEFEHALPGIVDDACSTDGCVRYEWYHVPDVSNQYAVYGEFDSEESFERYHQSNVVERIGNELLPQSVELPHLKTIAGRFTRIEFC